MYWICGSACSSDWGEVVVEVEEDGAADSFTLIFI